VRVLLLLVVLWAVAALPAAADDGQLCSIVADVSWQTDASKLTVDGAIVDVGSCEDGAPIGIQLVTDDGDVPPQGPLMGAVEGGQGVFDLVPYEQRIEPVTGVRVFLQIQEDEFVFFEVTVDRRFFSAPGNEQVGRRQVTSLHVPLDGEYVVPGAPSGYTDVACSDVNTTIDDDVVEQGTGTFTATEAGRHLACYRQTPGVAPGGPDGQGTEVLDGSVTAGDEPVIAAEDGVEVLGASDGRAQSAPGTGSLASTGANVWLLVGFGALLVAVGSRLVRPDRRLERP
jgi:hypothetical protein